MSDVIYNTFIDYVVLQCVEHLLNQFHCSDEDSRNDEGNDSDGVAGSQDHQEIQNICVDHYLKVCILSITA